MWCVCDGEQNKHMRVRGFIRTFFNPLDYKMLHFCWHWGQNCTNSLNLQNKTCLVPTKCACFNECAFDGTERKF